MTVTTTPSNYRNILAAIEDVALTQSGLVWAGSNLYEIPTPEQLEVGVPFLAVRAADLETWDIAGSDAGPMGMRQIDWIEPVWLSEVFAIFTYSNTAPNHDTAAQYLVSLVSAFTQSYNLEGTCATSDIIAGRQTTGLTYLKIGDVLYRAAKVTIRALEQLPVSYS